MSPMDPLTAMLCERLSYWHPLRYINLSGGCLTTKLLQLRTFALTEALLDVRQTCTT